MSVSRGFLIIAPLYLLVGVSIGAYMGATNDHVLVPAHAHINLLGFTLMTVFGLAYHIMPAAGASGLARVHFWLHQIGVLVLLTMLVMMLKGKIAETAMFPIAPIAELAILVGVVLFAINMFRHAR